MSDRLHEIGMKGCAQATVDDVVWLFEQVSRLREQVSMMREDVTQLNMALMNCTVELGLVDDD